MWSDVGGNLRLEIEHLFFVDLIGHSILLIEEQRERLSQLTEIVLAPRRCVRRLTNNSSDCRPAM